MEPQTETTGKDFSVRSRLEPVINFYKEASDFFLLAQEKRDSLEEGCLKSITNPMSFIGGILVERGLIHLPIPEEMRVSSLLIGAGSILVSRLAMKLISYKVAWEMKHHHLLFSDAWERTYVALHYFERTLMYASAGIVSSYLASHGRFDRRVLDIAEPNF
jgi:hypothetical protein